MKRMKLTPAGRFVVFVIIAAIIVCGSLAAWKIMKPANIIDDIKMEASEEGTPKANEAAKPVKQEAPKASINENITKLDNKEINLSLDEWIG